MPNFKSGSHDRVFSAQLNGAVSLTDPTTLLLREYKDKDNILFYDLNNIDRVASIVDSQLNDMTSLKKIAQAGSEIASRHHTWANISDYLINAINLS